ncbi:hypothetical protein AUJ59_01585 [Candidatus Beckwithbacteria bacterium CG1_02_47_37]|uniref:Transposase IS200-like domain-containing protein n=3 Tax=Candidatus Beckwithiibacteriota TaxID=1752726 RepID=A0A1J4RSZ1_9BACT|nr:MAG: hypothetical protein AUJ59_01585 [Candidatus Beckwithbacteria bacterium CG1_02_47_37]PIP52639.1 MAG: hypothetical protein COX09_00520 [Candidatus Beckwithbacteria bacterium CG23_combo_of_CG06-09_8_20_14_all_47_9]
MPAKNAIREYAPETYYHVYNRGVAKQNIFLDEQDYKVFLSYLKTYLSAPDKSEKSPPSKKLKNYFGRVKLLAYCLMPNHFHFFAWQKEIDALTGFMRAVMIKYSMFFNKKYRRVGPVFQGKFKAVMITNEPQFVFLSKYIHRNPISLAAGTEPAAYSYSSYRNYLGLINQAWLDTSEILSYFSKTKLANSYQNFIEELDDRDLPMIKEVMLDFEF